MRATRSLLIAGAAMTTLLAVGISAQADSPDDCCPGTESGYHMNANWWGSNVAQDREFVAAPFAVMIQKGWQEQNTLGSNQFAPRSGEPTDAGQQKIRSIVTQGPTKYRTVYVERGNTPEETVARIAATRKVAQRFLVDGEVANVQETATAPYGWPAEYIDSIHVKYQSGIPAPQLPKVGAALDLSGSK